MRDPVILDLDGNGISTISLGESTAYFDYNQDGFSERTGWVGPGDGILVFDANLNGNVDGAAEIFGSPTQDGFEVLETLDSNHDGKIDSDDAAFAKLRVWVDANGDGVSDAGEVRTLADVGVQSISLNRADIPGADNGNDLGFGSTFTRTDGTTGAAQTVYFATDPRATADPTPPGFTPAAGVEKLPTLPRSGELTNLVYKLSTDAQFLADWTALTDSAATSSAADLRNDFEQLLWRWAGADGVAPHQRGDFVDARHLAFVEGFFGETYREVRFPDTELATYPTTAAFGAQVEGSYRQIVEVLTTIYLAQLTPSAVARAEDPAAAFSTLLASPYFAYSLLDFRSEIPEGETPSPTPGNLGAVLGLIKALQPSGFGEAIDYLENALSGLNGVASIDFGGSQTAYAAFALPYLADISDSTIRQLATEIVNGTARLGTSASEAGLGTDGNDVFSLGKGDDAADGGAGNDLYIYRSGDGNDWINDDSKGVGEVDVLVLPDLLPGDLSFIRIAEELYIKVLATGHVLEINEFFSRYGDGKFGVESIRFADGSEWDRAKIASVTVFEGNGAGNLITGTPGNDLLQGGGGDLLRAGAGSDTIRYARGDGNDVIEDLGGSTTETDTLFLTNLKSSDVTLSRAGDDLSIAINATGEVIVDIDFFWGSSSPANWALYGYGLEAIRFADGIVWNRARLQQEAWVRGDDESNGLAGSGLNETLVGGKGDDTLSGGAGSDRYLYTLGDGNDVIVDNVSSLTDTDTLVLSDIASSGVRFAAHGDTLLITILATGDVIEAVDFGYGATSFTNTTRSASYGLDSIQFSDVTWGFAEIYAAIGRDHLGRDYEFDHLIIDGDVNALVYSIFTDEFGNVGDVIAPDAALQQLGIHNIIIGRTDASNDPFVINEYLVGTIGHNQINGRTGDDVLVGFGGHDVIFGEAGNDFLSGDDVDGSSVDDGHDILDGGDGNDVLRGGGGLDRLEGGAGDDELFGGAGKDYLSDSFGNDVFVGGAGNDIITSGYNFGSGNDTFIYARGDGNDVINDPTYSGEASIDTLRLTDLNASDIEFARVGDDLVAKVKSNGESVRIAYQFSYETAGSNPGIELIEFADGSTWNRAQIQAAAWHRGTDVRDSIFVSADTNDVVDAGLGDDVITSGYNFGSGNDTFIYARGDGNDVINDPTYSGEASIDTLRLTDLNASDIEFARVGDDLIATVKSTGETIQITNQFVYETAGSNPGVEFIQFADGSTWNRAQILAAAWHRGTNVRDSIFAYSASNNTVEAGLGDDVITSGYNFGSGSDTFLYTRGDGNDVINDPTYGSSETSTDTLRLKSISPDDLRLVINGSDIRISISGSADIITLTGQMSEVGTLTSGVGIDRVEFDDGTVWNRADIRFWATTGSVFYAGTNGNDTIVGSYLAQNLSGGNGNDVIDGKTGSDLIYGGLGNDTLVVSESNAGDLDALDGGAGIDTVSFATFGAALTIDFVGTGLGAAQLRDASQATIANLVAVENAVGTTFGDQVYGDGSANILDGSGGDDVLDGRSADDNLIGGDGDDVLIGGLGNDRLQGGNDADVLIGGLGNDNLEGGAGSDAYQFGIGSGHDTITEVGLDGAFIDSIEIGAGVLASDMRYVRRGNDLEIQTRNAADLLTIKNQFLGDNGLPQIERLVLADGTVITHDQIAALMASAGFGDATIFGTAGNDVISGTAGHDIFGGLWGNDSINSTTGSDTFVYASGDGNDWINEESGSTIEIDTLRLTDLTAADITLSHVGFDLMVTINATGQQIEIDEHFYSTTANYGIERFVFTDGTVWDRTKINSETWYRGTAAAETLSGSPFDDTFYAGGGNDSINSTTGSDTFVYASGDGNDWINEESGSTIEIDTLRLTDLTAADITLSHVGFDLMVTINATGQQIEIDEHFYSTTANYGIERFVFTDGTVWDRTKINSETWYRGDAANNAITGSAFDDNIDGNDGNDSLNGGAGHDRLFGGNGTDNLTGGGGNDALDGGAGTDTAVYSGIRSNYSIQRSTNGNLVVQDLRAASPNGTDEVLNIELLQFGDGTISEFAAANHAPIASSNPIELSITEDVVASSFVAASDAENDPLSFAIKIGAEPTKGTVAFQAGGHFMYSPNANINGDDTFTIVVSDGHGGAIDQVVTVGISPTNDAPVAVVDGGLGLGRSSAITIAASSLLANDTDPDGDALSVSTVGSALNGTVEIDLNGNIVFRSIGAYAGAGSFSYTTSDGHGGTAIAQVDVTIASVGGQTFTGTSGNDTLEGTAGDDTFGVAGDGGVDQINGGAGYDRVLGSASSDTIRVTSGLSNLLSVEEINGDSGTDSITGTASDDVLDFSGISLIGIENIIAGNGNDIVIGTSLADSINGGAGLDTLRGGAGNDGFFGGGGNDIVDGESGNDNIFGDGGDDRLSGGSGADSLTGGANTDTFVFSSGFGLDTVQDFKDSATENDILEFSTSVFATFAAAQAAMAQVGADVVVTYDSSNKITLKNSTISNFDQDDFRFIA